MGAHVQMRPEMDNWGSSNEPALPTPTAYYCIYNAVQGQPGLLHGKLNGPHGEHCAVGSYFATPGHHKPLTISLINEVAAVNDSVPYLSGAQRKAVVLKWLRWKLQQVGMIVGRGRRPVKDPSK